MILSKFQILRFDYFSYLKVLFDLMKPRVMSLVIFTCVVGLLIAPVKVDFLNASVYNDIIDETHLNKLVDTEPMWELFQHKEVVEQLFHIANHYNIVKQHLPTSLEQLAMILAIIRPGKRHLVGKSWKEIEADVWVKPDDGSYFFKKSHSYGYALAIIVQLNNMV